ncbi:energy-coupling factor transporter ATPase [Aristaeella hokkaidonensis]|uniref:Energy-coupling factor transporter ATPase n=1 Tax=Aristaeella hokkaidonensis TaxID=3046382 RepID=A0AC61MZP0_9FIRM|nr:energy-coupling factor transporter ATPase [Aristaeella hokkaidonensis]QUC67753.1 energy-coupling factor transporter ATPase [Aristaeella hokkaidonensis]SNT92804.1 energy-coupling factor transport system ATP-binding protein [Aristaeella hokkaidonensis]
MPIEVSHLTHCYSEGSALRTVALDDVSFRIKNGEFVGIIGHTGSGKSTLVQHLNGLLKPTSGQVLIDGEDLNGEHVNRRALRQRIGLVFQYPEYQLFEETVAKDIAFGPKNQGLSAAEIDERVRYAMDCVHLDYQKYAERSPFELSGGQMRRVAIAGVLAMKPSVLILDEPTAGLDPRGRDRILGMLEELHARENVTILMVSHSMDDMARLASRLIVMSDGKVVADGTPREIFMQEEMMTSIGLDIPEAARLCARLRAKGYDLPADLFRPEQLKEQLLRIWKEGSAC